MTPARIGSSVARLTVGPRRARQRPSASQAIRSAAFTTCRCWTTRTTAWARSRTKRSRQARRFHWDSPHPARSRDGAQFFAASHAATAIAWRYSFRCAWRREVREAVSDGHSAIAESVADNARFCVTDAPRMRTYVEHGRLRAGRRMLTASSRQSVPFIRGSIATLHRARCFGVCRCPI